MYKITFLLFIAITFNCTLIKPCELEFINNSNYLLKVLLCDEGKNELSLEKGKKDFFLVTQGIHKYKVIADEIYYEKDYAVNLNFQEDKLIEITIK